MIVLAPASVQEMASLTIKGFNLADKYLMTSMILADGTIGQMMEPISFEDAEIETYEKPWALTGTNCARKHNVVNSLYLKPDELEVKNFERYERYKIVEENEPMWEEYMMEDAEYCVVSYGIASRVAKNAVVAARAEGIKVGLIRPITLWPFPKKALRKAADQVKSFVCVELSMGQMIEDVRLYTECKKPVSLCNRCGGMIPSPDEVLESIRKAEKGVF
jgi:2-oxoglutarate ferredoxin oxidoreductase subunit alpha